MAVVGLGGEEEVERERVECEEREQNFERYPVHVLMLSLSSSLSLLLVCAFFPSPCALTCNLLPPTCIARYCFSFFHTYFVCFCSDENYYYVDYDYKKNCLSTKSSFILKLDPQKINLVIF